MSGGCICAICYEDVDPASELLQAIALCGHVFHELCLQQWIEFCPNGRAPTCPLCKQNCATKDVHRLYFQSVSDAARTTKDAHPQPSSQKKPSNGDELSPEDQAKLWRLEAKVTMLSAECKASKDKILQVESRGERQLEQIRVLEAERQQGRKEKGQLVETLTTTREELRRISKHREELLDRTEAMAKDLAVYKLSTDVNLSEVDMSTLISPPNGSTSKDDVIDMMRKALFLQNKNFKDLMHKCQELGLGESRAEHKSQKLLEQLKRYKAKMLQMAKAEEEKENAALRSLAMSSKSPRVLTEITRPNSGLKVSASENLPSVSRPHSKLKPFGEGTQPASPPLTPVSPNVICLESDTDSPEAQAQQTKVNRPGLVVGSSEMEFQRSRQRGSAAIQSSESQSQAWEGSVGRAEVRLWDDEEGCNLDIGSSGSHGMRPKLTIGLDGDIDNVDALRRMPTLPIRQELGLGQGVTLYARPQSGTGYQMPAVGEQTAAASDGTFILSGADGRGGKVRVLKPPRLVPGVSGSSRVLGVVPGKRFKPSSHVASSRTSALKIEHFFGRG